METLYDLLGALPNDDADGLRAAFRRAVKRAHPDINPGDPDAALKFRRIVRANEILGDAKQRAAYDHLLVLAHLEQEQATNQALTGVVHKLASSVMALAGISVVAVSGYALFVQLSANALAPTAAIEEAVREPVVIVAAEPAREEVATASTVPPEPFAPVTANTLAPPTAPEQAVHEPPAIAAAGPFGEEAASASAAPPETSGHADVPASANVPATEASPRDTAETAPGRAAPPLYRTPKHAAKFASGYIDRSTILYRLRKFVRTFAEHAKRLQRAGRPTASLLPQAANANANGNKKPPEGGVQHGA